MSDRSLLWRIGEVACYLQHSAEAGSYEVQVRDRGTVIVRRWFDNSADADAFIAECAKDFHATSVSLPHAGTPAEERVPTNRR